MNTVLIVISSFVLYLIAYHTYGRFLAQRIFSLESTRVTPAYEVNDGVDFVPSNRSLVFGHHFTSIAGTGPIVGPAIAVVWGWVPALIWVLLGSIFMGAVHDFGSLVISMRHRGRTIADLSGDVVSPRVRLLFMIVCVTGLWIVLAIFGLVIATIFRLYPQSVLPVFAQIPIAIALGLWVKRGGPIIPASIVALLLMYASIAYSASLDWDTISIFPEAFTKHVSVNALWTIVLMVYVFIASVLPVHVLLQPRDFINAWQLLVAMALLLAAIIWVDPPIVADAVRLNPAPSARGTATPPLFPFLFITIACGAISGFHCLVSSGCSSRQLRSELDAKPIGYGSMLTEGFLAMLVIIACVAGIGLSASGTEQTGRTLWLQYYEQWGGDAGLGDKLTPFILGSANMIEQIGISHSMAVTIMGVFVASFAATTLDSATRLQRYIIAELAGAGKATARNLLCESCGCSSEALPDQGGCPECGEPAPDHRPGILRSLVLNRYGATTIATSTALIFALSDAVRFSKDSTDSSAKHLFSGVYLSIDFTNAGLGGLTLWPIFGATNQLLAALALMVLSLWLYKARKQALVTAIPMTLMFAITLTGMTLLVRMFLQEGSWLLFMITGILILLQAWAILEASRLAYRLARSGHQGT